MTDATSRLLATFPTSEFYSEHEGGWIAVYWFASAAGFGVKRRIATFSADLCADARQGDSIQIFLIDQEPRR